MDKQMILTKITQLREQGKSANEIAEHFNELGIKSPRGSKWNGKSTSMYFYNNQDKISKYVKKAKKVLNHGIIESENNSNSDVIAILNSVKYSDKQKVEAVKALLS